MNAEQINSIRESLLNTTERAREMRLFAARCACHIQHLVSDTRINRAIETAACYADDLCTDEEMRHERRYVYDLFHAERCTFNGSLRATAIHAAVCAVMSDANQGMYAVVQDVFEIDRDWAAHELSDLYASVGVYA